MKIRVKRKVLGFYSQTTFGYSARIGLVGGGVFVGLTRSTEIRSTVTHLEKPRKDR